MVSRILLIDDDEIIRETLSLTLEEEGYCVDTAENGEEAIRKSYENFYNLAIIDWRLPDIEGTELLIGKLNKTRPKMCKIMLTGYPSMNNAIAAVNNRADSFLLKPIDFEFLLAKIGELLKLQEQAVELTQDLVVNYIETRSKEMLSTATTERSS